MAFDRKLFTVPLLVFVFVQNMAFVDVLKMSENE